MRNILSEIRDKTKSQTKNLGHSLYCTVNGVLTPVLFSETDLDGNDYYKEVFLTNAKKVRARNSLKQTYQTNSSFTEFVTTTTTKPQGTTTTTTKVVISPVIVLNYDFGVKKSGSNITFWNSSIGGYALEQSTTNNQPIIGNGRGALLSSSINFVFNDSSSTNDYMTLNNSITLTGDFTMFFFFEALPYEGQYKYLRLLGNSSDATTFVSASEGENKGYEFSVGGSDVEQTLTSNFQPTKKQTQLTVQRTGSTLIIRENGVEVLNKTCATTDFTFDQVGAIGSSYALTMNAKLYHMSAYNGYITTNLEDIERAIVTKSSLATQ